MIELVGLEKRFGRQTVLRGLDLRVERGGITAVVGPNASGKTTLIKAILGLVHPDRGRIRVAGEPIGRDSRYRDAVGYMAQNARLPVNLSAAEIFRFLEDLRGRRSPLKDELVASFRLGTEVDKPIRDLSGGTRQKVNVVIALMFDPATLILDEPTAGLDPVSSSRFKERVRNERAAGKTVLLTSHIVSELQELADKVVLLLDGRIEFAGTPDEVRARAGERNLERAFARMMAGEVRP